MEKRIMTNKVDLSTFNTENFDKGACIVRITLWYFVNAFFVRASWNPFMSIKIFLLRLFGAKIGHGMIIKNNVTIKSPWFLTAGENVWLGENCWIDNLDRVSIGNNVCISQGALILTGNHDYTDSHFSYKNSPITIHDGAWLGAKSVVCAGVEVGENAVLTVGSIATHSLSANTIYQGNPAREIRKRTIKQ